MGRSREGAWIEIVNLVGTVADYMVAPVRERGLKSFIQEVVDFISMVAPVRERGLKFASPYALPNENGVAPVRERGLKFLALLLIFKLLALSLP